MAVEDECAIGKEDREQHNCQRDRYVLPSVMLTCDYMTD